MGPACGDVEGGVGVRIPFKATRRAREEQGVAMSELTTAVASLGGEGRVDQDQGHAHQLRFVRDELAKLKEAPTVVRETHQSLVVTEKGAFHAPTLSKVENMIA
jgi:hypothetical protein